MSEHSQNGWPVVDRVDITSPEILGVEFPNGWLKGDVDVIFRDLILHLNTIERIIDGGCWGYFVKKIEGSASISNHASGTAIDYNAPNHPMGERNTYTVAKRAAIRALLKRYSGVVRWGGDYSGRPDDMHFEINTGAALVKAVANNIRKENDMSLSQKDIDAIWSKDVNPDPNASNLAYTTLYSTMVAVNQMAKDIAEIKAKLSNGK